MFLHIAHRYGKIQEMLKLQILLLAAVPTNVLWVHRHIIH
jgi:hypothetical protein